MLFFALVVRLCKMAFRIARIGAFLPVNISNAVAPCQSSHSFPEITLQPLAAASRESAVC
jgi:hypothetical protein